MEIDVVPDGNDKYWGSLFNFMNFDGNKWLEDFKLFKIFFWKMVTKYIWYWNEFDGVIAYTINIPPPSGPSLVKKESPRESAFFVSFLQKYATNVHINHAPRDWW